jgi:SAM-dependent methyltransferase
MPLHEFDADYYEHGREKGISLYTNYHWMPERSMREAHWFIQHMGIQRDKDLVVDFGCAKGYFVYALTLLGYPAIGYDTSSYALSSCPEDIKHRMYSNMPALESHVKYVAAVGRQPVGLCKDVLEHCNDDDHLLVTIRLLRSISDRWFITVPLACADCGKYAISEYELDVTHNIRYSAEKWQRVLESVFGTAKVKCSTTYPTGIKDHWAQRYPLVKGDLFVKVGCSESSD